MFKKISVLILSGILIFTLSACKNEVKEPISSLTASSEIAKTESTVSYPYDESGWGTKELGDKIVRPSFISENEDGDIFYCSSGDIYRQLAEKKSLSKVYSNSDYEFFSVQCIDRAQICAGFKGKNVESNYIIFDLKEKRVSNVVTDSQFNNYDIFSLCYFENAFYFLSKPDRYNRYTLYMQTDGKLDELQSGVNEFVIYRNRIFYNYGPYIFSMNPDGSDRQLIREVGVSDMTGFTIVNDMAIYVNAVETYICHSFTTDTSAFPAKIKTWTCTSDGEHTFFCCQDGGIYMLDLLSGGFSQVSQFTASDIFICGDSLYLAPARPSDYPDVDEKLIIKDGIYRFRLSQLIPDTENTYSSSEILQNNSSEINSESTENEEEPLVSAAIPEKFGR